MNDKVEFTIGHNDAGNVVLDFGKDVRWISFPPDQARELCRIILKHAKKGLKVSGDVPGKVRTN